jgi:hypothetical protein
MKIISNEMCSMQIVGVCGAFCMETDKILIILEPKMTRKYTAFTKAFKLETLQLANQANALFIF